MEIQVMLEKARVLLDQGRYKDAEAQICQALEHDPDNDQILSMLGRCYLDMKQYDRGIGVIQRAIAVDPNESFYFYLLGFAYYHKDMASDSMENLEKAIELNPYVPEYFGLLAFVLIQEREFEAALEKANEGLAIEAENINCLNARSTALNKLRRTDDAIETMNNALSQDPENETTHSTIGWNLLERGRHKEAQNHFMESLRINPDHNGARRGLKESLKSNIILYKWMLQYSFWVHNKGKKFRVAIPIAFYIVFRVLIKMSEENKTTENIGIILGGIYVLFIVISWTIGSIANFVLLFHPLGKHSLSNTEKWAAINTVSALIAGIVIMSLSGLASGTGYGDGAFLAGLVCFSLALPLGHIEYPVQFRGQNWRTVFGSCLIALGVAAILIFMVVPSVFVPLFAAYAVGFLIYNWSGVVS
jgi:tetratricopeptide (TPR) repeat protein